MVKMQRSIKIEVWRSIDRKGKPSNLKMPMIIYIPLWLANSERLEPIRKTREVFFVYETEKAVLLRALGGAEVWLPKSKIRYEYIEEKKVNQKRVDEWTS